MGILMACRSAKGNEEIPGLLAGTGPCDLGSLYAPKGVPKITISVGPVVAAQVSLKVIQGSVAKGFCPRLRGLYLQ